MVNRGRAFIYSTAPSPLMAAVVRAALKISAGADQERTQLMALVRHAGDGLKQLGLAVSRLADPAGDVGRGPRAPCAWRRRLQARGYDIRAIRPPTVPEGTARLRLALTLHVDDGRSGCCCSPISQAEMAQAMRFVVTGTDTDIGKTVFAAGLCGLLGARYWKPVQAGVARRQRNGGANWPASKLCRKPIG